MPKVSKESEYFPFVQCGLREYDAKIYTTLYRSESLTAKSLCNMTGIAQGKVYDSLLSLEEKGLIVHSKGTPRWYRAVSSEVFIAWIEAEHHKRIAHLRDYLSELDRQYRPFRMRDNITEFYSREIIDIQIQLSCQHAEKRVIVFCNSRKTLDEYKNIFSLIDEDVEVFIITDNVRTVTGYPFPCYKNTDSDTTLLLTSDIMFNNIHYYPMIQVFVDDYEWMQVWHNSSLFVGFLTTRHPQLKFIVNNIMKNIEPIL